jgi:hypothetical protein
MNSQWLHQTINPGLPLDERGQYPRRLKTMATPVILRHLNERHKITGHLGRRGEYHTQSELYHQLDILTRRANHQLGSGIRHRPIMPQYPCPQGVSKVLMYEYIVAMLPERKKRSLSGSAGREILRRRLLSMTSLPTIEMS